MLIAFCWLAPKTFYIKSTEGRTIAAADANADALTTFAKTSISTQICSTVRLIQLANICGMYISIIPTQMKIRLETSYIL